MIQLLFVHDNVKVLTYFLHSLVSPFAQHSFDVELSILIPKGILGLRKLVPTLSCCRNYLWIAIFWRVVYVLDVVKSAALIFTCSCRKYISIHARYVLYAFLVSAFSKVLTLNRVFLVLRVAQRKVLRA